MTGLFRKVETTASRVERSPLRPAKDVTTDALPVTLRNIWMASPMPHVPQLE